MLNFSTVKKIHLIAVCGTGMGSLAGLLKQSGYDVSGSDQNVYPPMSDQLKAAGITLLEGYRPDNLTARWSEGPDLVIVGNAVSKDNPEVQAMQALKIPYCSMPEALREIFLKGKNPIVVTGTHGKTSTSALASWLLFSAGRDPGFFVGGVLGNFNKSCRIGTGPDFVVEGDEYDTAFFDKGPKFVHYAPARVILGPIEFDHADIYRDLAHVLESFQKLMTVMDPKALLVACADSPSTRQVASSFKGRVLWYGLGDPEACDLTARHIELKPGQTAFELIARRKSLGLVSSPMAGRHNVQNLLGVLGVLLDLGLTVSDIQKGLDSFKGIKRRQELRGRVGDVCVIDDFAHHPTAVAETIEAIRGAYPGFRLCAIFEPRSNSSQRNVFQHDYAKALSLADEVIVANLFKPKKVSDDIRLDPAVLVQELKTWAKQNGRSVEAHFIPAVPDIVSFLGQTLRDPTVILVMSNGGFDNIHQKILSMLEGHS